MYTATPMKQVLPFSSEVGASARTVVRRLNFEGPYAHRSALKPKLTENQKVNRLAWAKDHRRWNRAQWSDVLFSDEATYVLMRLIARYAVFQEEGRTIQPGYGIRKD